MHFVGMLAMRLPFQVDYLVLPTLLSFLVCAIVVGAAVYATSSGPLTLLRLTLSSCLMGGGIFAMHYLGMSALDASAHMVHNPIQVAASMAIAIAASGLALWLATGRAWRAPLILSAAAFGMAISGMHYTAMTGVTLYPFVTSASAAPALSTDLLAIVVAVVAFCVSGIFFLLLLPDSARAEPTTVAAAAMGPVAQAVGADAAAGAGGGGKHRTRSRRLWPAGRRRLATAFRPASADRARRQYALFPSRAGDRDPCQCALHLRVRRQ